MAALDDKGLGGQCTHKNFAGECAPQRVTVMCAPQRMDVLPKLGEGMLPEMYAPQRF